jgi:hypothetical protein
MQSAKNLREKAARLLALAISAEARDDHELAEMYTKRAGELLELNPVPAVPDQPVAQQQQQIQKDKE